MVSPDPIPRPPSRKHSCHKVPTLNSPFSASPTINRPPSPTVTGAQQEVPDIPPLSTQQSSTSGPLSTIHEDKVLTAAKDWLLGRSKSQHAVAKSAGSSQDVAPSPAPKTPQPPPPPHTCNLVAVPESQNLRKWTLPSALVGERLVDGVVRVAPETERIMEMELVDGPRPLSEQPPVKSYSMKDSAELSSNTTSKTAKPEPAERGAGSAVEALEVERSEVNEPNGNPEEYWNGSTNASGKETHYCGPDIPCKLETKCASSVPEARDDGREERRESVFGNPMRALFRVKKREREELKNPSSVGVVRFGDELTRVVVQEVVDLESEPGKDGVKVSKGEEEGVKGEGNGKKRWRRWWASWTDHGGKKGWLRRVMVERRVEGTANETTNAPVVTMRMLETM